MKGSGTKGVRSMKRWMAVLLAGLGALWMAAHLQGCAGGGAGSGRNKGGDTVLTNDYGIAVRLRERNDRV